MSETNPNIKSTIAKSICVIIDGVNKFIPVQSIDSVSCFYNWLDSHYKLASFGDEYIQADYYNGSENDLKNIFIEIQRLATTDHCFNGNYVLKRLEFLANEGLHIADIFNSNNPTFKVTEEEANEILAKYANKTKKVSKAKATKNIKKAVESYKKNVKSSEGLKPLKKKPAKRLMRDKKGRFIKNK
jgi:hypothetical protein